MLNEQTQFCDAITLDKFYGIQSHGVLLIINRENLHIVQCSENVTKLLTIAPDKLLNVSINHFLKAKKEYSHFILNSHQKWKKLRWTIGKENIEIFAYVQQYPEYIMLEIELFHETLSVSDFFDIEQEIVMETQASQTHRTFSELVNTICNKVISITDSDRVVIYQFDKDKSGIVIAEALKEGMDAYLGLRFPATDMPRHVRDMYLKNYIRYIPSANAESVQLVPTINPLTKQMTDLSDSYLRMVAPVHVKYMENMEINSSVSFGIVYDNDLWGIVACHSKKAKITSVSVRFLLTLITNTLSSQLIAMESEQALNFRNRSLELQNSFSKMVYEVKSLNEVLHLHSKQVLELVNAEGMTLFTGGKWHNFGGTPSIDQIEELIDWLQKMHPETTYVSDSLFNEFPAAKKFKKIACGVISIPISSLSRFFLLFYRPEKVREIAWAGEPTFQIKNEKDYSPRDSFKRCLQIMKDHSNAWNRYDVTSAEFVGSIIKNRILNDYLQQQVTHDFLTGLLNRQTLDSKIIVEMARAKRDSKPLSLMMIDIDHFKVVNDTYGHTGGDAVLVSLANFLKNNFRAYDGIYRYGGEEFLIVLPGLDSIAAQKKGELVQQKMKTMSVLLENKMLPYPTMSIGISEYPLHAENIQQLIDLSDQALYQAKQKGRDRIEIAKADLMS